MKIGLLGSFVCMFALLGCGSSAPKKVSHISSEEVNFARNSEVVAVGILNCIHAEQQSGDSKTIVGGRSEGEDREVGQAIRNLIASFRKNPAAIWPSEENPTRSARTYLAEKAESLQQFCWPWLAREIRTVLTYG